jgi:hypothetical protein
MRKHSKSVLAVATRHDLGVIVELVGFACHSLFRELIRGSQNREQQNERNINCDHVFDRWGFMGCYGLFGGF